MCKEYMKETRNIIKEEDEKRCKCIRNKKKEGRREVDEQDTGYHTNNLWSTARNFYFKIQPPA